MPGTKGNRTMKNTENILSPERIAAIRADLSAIPDAPVGPHLTVEQSLACAKAGLAADGMAEFDRHVASCLDCATKLERWIMVVDFLIKLFQSAGEKLEFWWRPAQRAAFGFCTKREVKIAGPDRMVGLYMVENEGGNLELRVDSRHLECEGRTLRLRVGERQHDLRLRKVDAEQVGGQMTISREEREKLPEGAVPEVELLP